jgi:hypothetical protein
MTNLPNLALMSVVEYADFLESTALYTGVDPYELNMEYCFEMGAISNERFERAKWELVGRKMLRPKCDDRLPFGAKRNNY